MATRSSTMRSAELGEGEMVDDKPSGSFEELWTSLRRVRGAGARLAERIQRTAETYSGEDTVARLVADARGVQDQLRRQAERVLKDIEGGRTRIVDRIERQTARLVAQGVKRLNLASEAELRKLRVRVADCERRLGAREVEVHPAPDEVQGKPIR